MNIHVLVIPKISGRNNLIKYIIPVNQVKPESHWPFGYCCGTMEGPRVKM